MVSFSTLVRDPGKPYLITLELPAYQLVGLEENLYCHVQVEGTSLGRLEIICLLLFYYFLLNICKLVILFSLCWLLYSLMSYYIFSQIYFSISTV